MAQPELTQELLLIEDRDQQRRFLSAHASSLDGDQVIQLLKEQADQYLRADIGRSLELVDLMHYFTDLTANPLHRAQTLLAEGNARSIGLGEYQKAIQLYDEATEIYRSKGCLLLEAKAQVGELFALAFVGRYGDAMEIGLRASSILEEHGEWLALGKVTVNLAIIQGRLGEDIAALELFDRAREFYGRLGQEGQSFRARVEINRSIVLRNLGRFDDSIQAAQAAWDVLVDLGQTVEAARARQNLAITFYILGRYNEALDVLGRVRDIFLADGRQRDAIRAELFMSDCLLQLRRFSDVLEKSQRVRELFVERGTSFEVAQTLLNEAVAYSGLRRYAEALTSLAEARRLFEKEGNEVWTASTDLETAVVLYHRGRYEDCLVAVKECAAVFERHKLPVEKARADLIASRAAAAMDQHEQARGLVIQVLTNVESMNIPSLTYQCRHLLGNLYQAGRDHQAALDEYDRAIQELERLRGRLMVEYRVGFLEDKQIVYEDAVRLCLDQNLPLKGLEYAERAKSRALLDLLAHRLDLSVQARHSEDEPLVRQLMQLRSERDRVYRTWEADAEMRERGRQQEVQQDVLAVEKQITDLWHQLLIRNADYARDAALWQVRTESVQPYLDDDILLLEFFIAHQELVVFTITRETLSARYLPGDLGRIQQLMRLLWLNLRAVPKSSQSQVPHLERNARSLLHELYELLLAPVADELSRYRRVLIVPHGLLHYLPFHALYDGNGFLLERHEFSYLPGASLLRYCRQVDKAASGLSAVGYSHRGRLPYTVQEARSIAALLDGQVLSEGDATLSKVRQAASGCRVLHLATHGDFRPDNPLFSGLVLSDGWLTTLDIFNLRLKASLVTLSACETGRNVVGGGDELLGLMRAFLYAGAASLILSFWSVADRSTAQLMETFYRKLAEGWTKGAALQYAQLNAIKEQREEDGGAQKNAHPYFWAPFFLVGDPGPL